MYLERYLYSAKKLIIKKDCTLEDLDEAAIYLNNCKGLAPQTETRIDVWLGKLELKRSKLYENNLDRNLSLSNAKNSFFMSLSKGYSPSAYSGLFKVAIAEEDWKSALEYLTEYEKSDRKKHYNFNLIHMMLNTCMNLDVISTYDRSDYIFSNKVKYMPLRKNYLLAEEAFNEGKYNVCLKHLSICQKLAIKKSITIDFSIAISLIQKIIAMKNVVIIEELKSKLVNSKNSGEKLVLIRKLISLSPEEIDLYFMLMDSYIELGIYSSILDVVTYIPAQKMSEIDKKRLDYYINLAQEQDSYNGKIINVLRDLQAGEASASNGDIYHAYNTYLTGFKTSGNSVFLSKIGDLLYTNGYYRQAELYYTRYLSSGYKHQYEVYINLYKVYRQFNDIERATTIALEAFNNLFLEFKGFTLKSWLDELEMQYNQEVNKEDSIDVKVKILPSSKQSM